jgi:acetyl esterase/lipase
MTRILRSFGYGAIVLLMAVSGCTRMPSTPVTTLKPNTLAELQSYLLGNRADLELFRSRGPFGVTAHEDYDVRLSRSERVRADLYLSAPAEKAPLVILVHGHDNTKSDHAFQAMHLASWGMHTLSVQLPPKGPWLNNGRILGRLVRFIQRSPQSIDSRIDPGKIILAGHSFGGSAVVFAMAEGAPAAGGILLDPAAIGRDLPSFLRRISRPVMVLGADDAVSPTRNRDYFFEYVRSNVAEISIKDAAHEDAQYPSDDPDATEALQITFVSALTAAAFSLSATGNLDYAWKSFASDLASGKLFNPKRK